MIFAQLTFDFSSITDELLGLGLGMAAMVSIIIASALLCYGFGRCMDFVWKLYDRAMFSDYDREDYGSFDAYHRHQDWLRKN